MPHAEFSRPVSLRTLPAGELTQTLVADAGERAALSRRFGILDMPALEAMLRVRRSAAGDTVTVKGELRADVVQSCVVTLDPVPARVVDRFELRFSREAALGEDLDIDLSAIDTDIEPLEGDILDLGEIVAQQLLLALEPYPRAPGVAYQPLEVGPPADDGEDASVNPFFRLGPLRPGGRSNA